MYPKGRPARVQRTNKGISLPCPRFSTSVASLGESHAPFRKALFQPVGLISLIARELLLISDRCDRVDVGNAEARLLVIIGLCPYGITGVERDGFAEPSARARRTHRFTEAIERIVDREVVNCDGLPVPASGHRLEPE